MKRRIAVGLLIAAIIFALLISFVGREDVVRELSAADPAVIGLGLLSGLLALSFRGMVWVTFLSRVDETMTLRRVFPVFLAAMFVKYATPYGQVATEPFVAYLVARDAEMAYEGGLAGVLSSDLLNYLPYYTFGFAAAVVIATVGTVSPDIHGQVAAFVGLFVIVSGAAYVVVFRERVIYRLTLTLTGAIRRGLGRFSARIERLLASERVEGRLEEFYGAVITIRGDRWALSRATIYAHIGMGFLMTPVFLGAISLGYEIEISVVALVVALGKLGSIVPAPGGLGGVETSVTIGLTILGGFDPAAALAIALIYRLCTYWLTLFVGGASALFLTFRV